MKTVPVTFEKTSNKREIKIPIPPVIMRGFLKLPHVISFSVVILLIPLFILIGLIYNVFDLWPNAEMRGGPGCPRNKRRRDK